MSKISAGGNPFAPYLDHDHRERENVCFLAVCSLLGQDFWGSPSCGVTLTFRGDSHGIQLLSDRRETKIGDSCVASVIYEDIWLDTYQYGHKTGLI